MSTSVDDTTILELLRSNDAPRMTTTEVADQLPITRGRTRTRLQQLVEDDKLERTREGNNVVWWLPERKDELEGEDEAEEGEEPAEPPEPADEETGEAAEAEPAASEAGEPATSATGGEERGEPASAEEAGEPAEPAAEPEDARATDEDTESATAPDVEDEADEAEERAEGVGVPTDRDETAEAPVAGAEAGDSEVPVESVESLERGDRTPDAETEARSAAERAGQPEPAPDDEGLRALALVAVLLVAVVLFRKLFGGGE